MSFWYDIGSALLAQLNVCLPECEYATYVGTGRPTADCNSIVFWPSISSYNGLRMDRCVRSYRTERATITLTRICGNVDSQVQFDPAREDKDAQCFYEDLERIVQCLICDTNDVLKPFRIDCGDESLVRDVVFEVERLGDGYQADVILQFDRALSCDCP